RRSPTGRAGAPTARRGGASSRRGRSPRAGRRATGASWPAARPRSAEVERDLVGYGADPPVVPWPNGARLAVQVSLNYEEGAEHTLLEGPTRETMGEVPSPVPPDRRDLYNESMFEYGSRVGVWRLLRTLGQYDVPATWWACA